MTRFVLDAAEYSFSTEHVHFFFSPVWKVLHTEPPFSTPEAWSFVKHQCLTADLILICGFIVVGTKHNGCICFTAVSVLFYFVYIIEFYFSLPSSWFYQNNLPPRERSDSHHLKQEDTWSVCSPAPHGAPCLLEACWWVQSNLAAVRRCIYL